VDVAPGHVAQTAGVIVVQVADEDDVDILRSQSQSLQVTRDALVIGHLRRLDLRPLRFEEFRAQRWIGNLFVVAAGVVEDPSIRRLDQISEDRSIDKVAVAAVSRRHDFFVTLRTGEQWPETNGAGHGGIPEGELRRGSGTY
jgi:hypothetical protein